MRHVEETIRTFLADRVLPGDEVCELSGEADLLQGRVLNSLTLVHLVDYIEETFDLRVLPAEFSVENFRTIHRICAFVEAKRGAPATEGSGSARDRSG